MTTVQAESIVELAEFVAPGIIADEVSAFDELLHATRFETFLTDIKKFYNHSFHISGHTDVNWSFPSFPTFKQMWMRFIIVIS